MNKIAKTGVAALAFGVTLWATMANAFAGDLDGVTSEVNTRKTELVSFVTGTGVPVVFGLAILGIGIALALRYLRRGARSA